MEKETIIRKDYSDATLMKLKNRRVLVRSLPDDEVGIEFKKLVESIEDANNPSSFNHVEKGKVKVTCIRISLSAAVSLYHALGTQLASKYNKQSNQ